MSGAGFTVRFVRVRFKAKDNERSYTHPYPNLGVVPRAVCNAQPLSRLAAACSDGMEKGADDGDSEDGSDAMYM